MEVCSYGFRLDWLFAVTTVTHTCRLEILKHIGAYDQTLLLASVVSKISEMNIIMQGLCCIFGLFLLVVTGNTDSIIGDIHFWFCSFFQPQSIVSLWGAHFKTYNGNKLRFTFALQWLKHGSDSNWGSEYIVSIFL